jgi:uncharacterized membrane protein
MIYKNKKGIIGIIAPPNVLPKTFGQKAADKLTKVAGSWGFILGFIAVMTVWIAANGSWILFGERWDPYPFILLNLALSCLAAIQAPIILMSQNREAQKDRQRAEYDYAVNRKAEKEIQQIKEVVERIEKKLK